ncbi:hypothetical protein [Methylovorus glucosotrophus]|uniref:Uncharacterized protein n=1 Tax=Methylovorus glucosotrophus (strain SIP3-4) TaxID=582744 RepID=C6XEC8_METGS|nr:hypothetical protein [Methylovorus glucosotrophus]ACT50903.1 hypothetical protein Msip34_1658 [Methylovorus glucosotrophus SIP3-4]
MSRYTRTLMLIILIIVIVSILGGRAVIKERASYLGWGDTAACLTTAEQQSYISMHTDGRGF